MSVSAKTKTKTKNSSNKDRMSAFKTLDRIASSFEIDGGDETKASGQMTVFMMIRQQSQAHAQQMQQQQQVQQVQAIQQQFQQFHQSLQSQLKGMDWANKNDKILKRLLKLKSASKMHEKESMQGKCEEKDDNVLKPDSDESSTSSSDRNVSESSSSGKNVIY